jgi:hypothetical protein
MNNIKTTGSKITNYKKMKQSKLVRIEFELNLNDSQRCCGTLAVAEQNDLLADLIINFTQIEGENNGYEKQIAGETIYQKFKRKCLEYFGENYYQNVKDRLGLKHLRDLEAHHDIKEVSQALQHQIAWMDQTITGRVFLISKLNPGYELWKNLFNNINTK